MATVAQFRLATPLTGRGTLRFIRGNAITPSRGIHVDKFSSVTCPQCGYTMLFSEEVLPL
jgi:hypothetical protein